MWAVIAGSALLFTRIFDLGIGLILIGLAMLILRRSKRVRGAARHLKKKCLRCGETVKAEALICHICSFEFAKKNILLRNEAPGR